MGALYIVYFLAPSRYYVSSRLNSTIVVGLAELRRERTKYAMVQKEMLPNDFDTYRWRTAKLIELLEQTGPDTRLRLVEWHVTSDNETFFNFNETEFATCVHKLITPTHVYCCMESHGSLLTSTDIFQENVGSPNGPAEWVDKLPFYHSMENCSVTDLQCTHMRSCKENSLNRDVARVVHPPVIPPVQSTAGSMDSSSSRRSIQERMTRSRMAQNSTIRPYGSYMTPRLVHARYSMNIARHFTYPSMPLFDYPADELPAHLARLAPIPIAQLHPPNTSRRIMHEPMHDDDPAFDDMPELS